MPGRISARASGASRVSRKSSVPTLKSRASFDIPNEGPDTALRTKIGSIFADAQKSTAGHRKLVTSLRKVQEACVYEPVRPGTNGGETFGEEEFNGEVARCVLRVVAVKKSETVGDRVVRFLGIFLRHASEKDNALIPDGEVDETGSFPETASTRLTSYILSILLPLQSAKDKVIRYRATQIISHIINSLDSIDDEYYHLLRVGLLKRIYDKEAMVRVQAVLGLGRLAGNEGDDADENGDSDDDDAVGLLAKLLDVLQNDSSADVRRSLLLNLPLTPSTLPYLLERARDLDPATRRALYSRLLPALGDFRHLSLSMREKLLRWGLRDRDEHVRKATARLFRERWIEDCVGPQEGQDNNMKELAPPNIEALQELLERIDIVNSGVEDGIALEALKEFWDGRPDYQEAIKFEDPFWDNLTAESVFLARSFNDYCRKQQTGSFQTANEEKLPEVTKLAFMLQRYTNNLVTKLKLQAETEEKEDTVEQEFIVEQLLHIAQTLDYSDEVGRRKMFSLLRECLAVAELPEEITKLVVEVLRYACGSDLKGEREFCGVVLEAIAEVHDLIAGDEPTITEDAEESFHSARSEVSDGSTPTKTSRSKKSSGESEEEDEEKAIKEIMVNMRCLHIAECMLENVEENLQDNVHLVTMLNNLVVPAVRSHEAPIRERGLHCLGLCCLLDKTLASENLSLFLHCYQKGHPTLQTTSLQTLSDILLTHPSLLPSPTATSEAEDEAVTPPSPSKDASHPDPLLRSLHRAFSKALRNTTNPTLQTAAVTALCKLYLTSIFTDLELLKQVVISFFEPSTRENPSVRQALSYFLPVYAHSKHANMEHMGEVAVAVVRSLVGLQEDGDAEVNEGEEMVGMTVVTAMLADWTDGRKLVGNGDDTALNGYGDAMASGNVDNGEVHLGMAEELLERVLERGCAKPERKALLTLLSKLHVPIPISSSNPTHAPSSMASSSPFSTTSPEPHSLSSPHADTSTPQSVSYTEKLTSVLSLATEAIDAKIAPDVTTRNALLKFQLMCEKVKDAMEKAAGAGNGGGVGEKVSVEKERLGKGRKSVLPLRSARPSVMPVVEQEHGREPVTETAIAVYGKEGSAETDETLRVGDGTRMEGVEETALAEGDGVKDSVLEELLEDEDTEI
ncbi:hypothetical protein MMC25_004046 [Agyrium rufum]|nr:hypothetical protein [Agyrium rufum]